MDDKDGLVRALARHGSYADRRDTFRTGVGPLDGLAPGGFCYGAVHELLSEPHSPSPQSLTLMIATSAGRGDAAVVWSDPACELYPPALAAAGLDLRRLILLRPATVADELWAVAECLRCKGVGATVARVGRLSQVQARRLQLAAERGGGVGLFLRELNHRSTAHYAAATRWLVRPAPGSDDAQRWRVELMHGHGGQVGRSVLLEVDRETGAIHAVRTPAAVADRPAAPPAARPSA